MRCLKPVRSCIHCSEGEEGEGEELDGKEVRTGRVVETL